MAGMAWHATVTWHPVQSIAHWQRAAGAGCDSWLLVQDGGQAICSRDR